MKTTVKEVTSDYIIFTNGVKLSSDHESDCCEWHEIDFSDLTIEDFNDLEFDLTDENFFNRIEGYGIELTPIKGHSVKVPGYGYNNGYYGSNIDLILEGEGFKKIYDVSEC